MTFSGAVVVRVGCAFLPAPAYYHYATDATRIRYLLTSANLPASDTSLTPYLQATTLQQRACDHLDSPWIDHYFRSLSLGLKSNPISFPLAPSR